MKSVTEKICNSACIEKGRRVLCQGVKAKYAFMQALLGEFRMTSMCRVLGVQRSGFYAW